MAAATTFPVGGSAGWKGMARIALLAGVFLIAAFAVWHPAPAPAPFAAASESPKPSGRRLPRSLPAAPAAVVYVAGAVARPGLYTLRAGARVADAVRLAGGLRGDADPLAINLAARVQDGDEVAVVQLGDRMREPRTARSGARARTRARKSAKLPPVALNVNTADAQMLASVPGIGATLAERIIAIRESDGPYETLDQLLDVAGMTASRLDRVRSYLSI